MKEEPPTSAKCRDKFLVQSCLITPERETTSLSDIWGVVEKEDKNAVHEQKIRCAFLPATSAAVPEEDDGNVSNGGDDVSDFFLSRQLRLTDVFDSLSSLQKYSTVCSMIISSAQILMLAPLYR